MRLRLPAARALAVVLAALIHGGCDRDAGFSDAFVEAPPPAAIRDDLDTLHLGEAARATVAALERRGRSGQADPQFARTARVVAAAAEHPGRLGRVLRRRCRWYAAREAARVTAYYEPRLSARRERDDRYRHPLYRMPEAATLADVERRLGHPPSRADIDGAGVLAGLGLEFAWLEDPVERFFLHVQGSGRLHFDDGSVARAAYGGNNGMKYTSIGSIMLQRGLLQKGAASASAMRAWLSANPQRRDELLFENPRYIFFAPSHSGGETDGPSGSLGAPLVPGRSLATDPQHIQPGCLLYLRSRRPVLDGAGRVSEWKPLERFAFSHDTGAAIQGPSRVDVFWGSGPGAGAEAGYMNEAGELFALSCRRPRKAPRGELR
ncbi:MAG TPA: MltA domain-containing protein [Candidatus Binatia bacterium]|nr:MltA domain-containing protein [Candidatus Binatia bacterium]